jgi:hypothetical protein
MAILGRRLRPDDRPVGRPDGPGGPRPERPVVPTRTDGDRAASLHVLTGRDGAASTGGEASRNAKLTQADVDAIRAADYADTPRAELAARYGVRPKRITEIRQGKGWSAR